MRAMHTLTAFLMVNLGFAVSVDASSGESKAGNIQESNNMFKPDGNKHDDIQVLNACNVTRLPLTGAAGMIFMVSLSVVLKAIIGL